MILYIILIVVIGAFAGWIASMIMHVETGFWMNAFLGIIGSIVGGFLARLLHLDGFLGGFADVLGACLIIFLVNKLGSKR